MTKDTFSRIAIVLVMALSFTLTSCEPDHRRHYYERDLIGDWYSQSYDGYYLTTLSFFRDGFGVIEDWEGDYLVQRDRFEWDASGRHIYILYEFGDEDRWRYRFHDFDELTIDYGKSHQTFFRDY